MRTFRNLITGLFLTGLTSGCQKAFEAYLGLPMQPENINAVFEPGLNIFGIIKAGPSLDTINHFFEVHGILHVFDTSQTMQVDDATIELKRIRTGSPNMDYTLNSVSEGRYSNTFISTLGGDRWEYQCLYDTFLITASTIVPQTPKIQEGSMTFSHQKIRFNITPDSTAFMHDVYYYSINTYDFQRLIPIPDTPTTVEINAIVNQGTHSSVLYVIAYDANYEKYISTSNTFFKPNAYRPRFSTVTGGYGCFCSANILHLQL